MRDSYAQAFGALKRAVRSQIPPRRHRGA